jgi:hypothetical protein
MVWIALQQELLYVAFINRYPFITLPEHQSMRLAEMPGDRAAYVLHTAVAHLHDVRGEQAGCHSSTLASASHIPHLNDAAILGSLAGTKHIWCILCGTSLPCLLHIICPDVGISVENAMCVTTSVSHLYPTLLSYKDISISLLLISTRTYKCYSTYITYARLRCFSWGSRPHQDIEHHVIIWPTRRLHTELGSLHREAQHTGLGCFVRIMSLSAGLVAMTTPGEL